MAHSSQSEQLDLFLAWVIANRTKVVTGAAVIAIAGAGFGLYAWQERQEQRRASQALFNVPPLIGTGRSTEEPKAADYLGVHEQFPATQAGENSLLVAAGLMFSEGRFDEAEATFRKFLEAYPQSELRPQAALGIAASLAAQTRTDAAIEQYQEVVARHPNTPVAAPARFQLAVLLEEQSRFAEALKLYEELTQPGSFSAVMREAMMRKTELLESHPELAPTKAPGLLSGRPQFGLTNLPLNLTNPPEPRLPEPGDGPASETAEEAPADGTTDPPPGPVSQEP